MTHSDIRPDLHWLLFLWATQSYDNDLILLALRPYVQRLSPG
jgi:hypothetical protein